MAGTLVPGPRTGVIGLQTSNLKSQETPEGTTVKPFEESQALVTGGVFRISRNPMYLGMTLILLGVTLILGSVTPS